MMANPREKLFDFAALCLWLVMSAVMAIYVFMKFGQDFRGYYAAAHVLLEGGNPYDYINVARVLVDITGRAGNNPFYYPLWFGWFITPLTLLPFQAARVLWMIINWVLWMFGLIRLQRLLGFPTQGWRGWLMHALATFLFAWTTWKFEQTGILLFVILVEILTAYKHQHWGYMGVLIALALIKPNIMLMPFITILVWLIKYKNWRPVLVALVTLLLLISITTILTPGWYQTFSQPKFGQGLTEVLDGPNQITGTRINTTLLDWLKSFNVPEAIQYGIYVTVVCISLWLLASQLRRPKSILELTILSILVSFAITPYALQYDFPPLVIVLFWALAQLREVKQRFVPYLMVMFLGSVLIWERPISDGYWIVIGLGALTYWAFHNSIHLGVT